MYLIVRAEAEGTLGLVLDLKRPCCALRHPAPVHLQA